jgi:hypothetical protein
MSMLVFFPWLKLRAPVQVGRFYAFPHCPGEALPHNITSSVSAKAIQSVFSQYRQNFHTVVSSLTVIQFDRRPLGDVYDSSDRDAIYRFGKYLAATGLSDRRFLGGISDDYTATGHYQLIIQSFDEPYCGSVNVTHRRKGGHTNVHMGQTDVHFVLPAHLVEQGTPNINIPLLTALQATEFLPKAIREHVDASISQFLLSNSDSPDVSPDVEIAAAYSALERLVDVDAIASIKKKLLALLRIYDTIPAAASLRKELPNFDSARPEFQRWIGQLYNVRGRLAHGKTADGYNSDWSTFEHGVAAAFVYPLVLKAVLIDHGLMQPTIEDVAHVVGLEGLLGKRPFYAEPSNDNPDEFEQQVRAKSGWILNFDAINSALLGEALLTTLRETYKELDIGNGSQLDLTQDDS